MTTRGRAQVRPLVVSAAPPLRAGDLVLEPLAQRHAHEMARVVGHPELYRYLAQRPADEAELAARYRRQVVGHSPDGRQQWLNWVLRDPHGQPAGFVQATVLLDADALEAELAWMVSPSHQGRGHATRAARAVMALLARRGVRRFFAHIHPDNAASERVATRLGLRPSGYLEDGEQRWAGEYRHQP